MRDVIGPDAGALIWALSRIHFWENLMFPCGRFRAFSIAAVLLAALAVPAFAGPNLLVNSDFEAGNTGFTTGYTYNPTFIDTDGLYTVASNPANVFGFAGSFGDHTTGHGLMAIFNGSTTPNTVAWQETLTVTPGTIYDFSGWIATSSKSGTFNEIPIDLHPADTKFVV